VIAAVALTVKFALDRALIVTLPAATPVTTPDALTVATVLSLEDQSTAVDTPAPALTVAVIGNVLPMSTTPTVGATDTETDRAASSVTGVVRLLASVAPCLSSNTKLAAPAVSVPVPPFKLLALMTPDIVQSPTGSVPSGLEGQVTSLPPAARSTAP
jgi:hypothetical protein